MHIEPDIRLLALVTRQHGVFTRAQAKACGFSNRMIQHRLATGRWELLHPEVYGIGGAPQSWRRDEIAACYWSGGAAGGVAAGHLHKLPGCDQPPLEVVTHLRHKITPRCGIIVHCTKRLPTDQITSIDGIPVTSIERTLFDLCGQWRKHRAAIAVDNALFRSLTTIGDLDYCLYRTARRGRKGCALLRELVKERAELDVFPNSALETVMFEELFAPGLIPMPELQYEIRDSRGSVVARPDFVYPDERLVIEGHSRLWHEGVEAKKSDLERHDDIVALDYRIVYVTWADATRYAEKTVAKIQRLRRERSVPRASERAHV